MKGVLLFVLLILCAPAAYIGVMSLVGATVENRKALWMATIMVVAIVVFAGLTIWP